MSSAIARAVETGTGNRRPANKGYATLFCSVKSKCFLGSPGWTCIKPAPSCFRHRCDFSAWPLKSAWRIVSRAIDAAARDVSQGISCTSLNTWWQQIRAGMGTPMEPSVPFQCGRCRGSMQGFNCVTVDVDQAFEGCGGEPLLIGLTSMGGQVL